MLVLHGVNDQGVLEHHVVEGLGEIRATLEPTTCRVCVTMCFGEDHLGGVHPCCLRWGSPCLACQASAAFWREQARKAAIRLAGEDQRAELVASARGDGKRAEALIAAKSLGAIRAEIDRRRGDQERCCWCGRWFVTAGVKPKGGWRVCGAPVCRMADDEVLVGPPRTPWPMRIDASSVLA